MADEWRESAPGSGVLLRCVGHQRPRHPGTGPGSGTRQRRRHPTEDRIMAVPPVVHLGRGTAPHRLPLDRLGGRASGCHPGGPGLHPGPPARAPASPHRRHRRQPNRTHRGAARRRRGRHPVSGRRRTRRPGTGVGVLRSGFAVGTDGYRSARERTGVRRDNRTVGAVDRRRVRILGDRGDDGTRGGHRYRPGTADSIRHPGCIGGHHGRTRGAPGCGDRALDGRDRRGGGRRRTVTRRRCARHLPSLPADGHHRRLRSHGIGRTSRQAGALGVDHARHQGCGGGGGGLAHVDGDRRRRRHSSGVGGSLGAA